MNNNFNIFASINIKSKVHKHFINTSQLKKGTADNVKH